MYQLIAFDMDGTLLGSDKQISPGNRRAIAAAARAGKTVILNTGRCLSELEEYLGLIPEVRYLNCASAGVRLEGETHAVFQSSERGDGEAASGAGRHGAGDAPHSAGAVHCPEKPL